ncbi:MAG: LacI family DNA-binding transcriptional regulator [Proteocatella sp.]
MKITINDIAKMAGVSKGTVSRVINNKAEGVGDEVRQRVKNIIDEVGYKPNQLARSIVTSKSKTIGLIIPDITNPFFPKLVRGIEDYAFSKDYTVFLCNSDENIKKEEYYLCNFIEKRVDGIILAPSRKSSTKLNQLLKDYDRPVAVVDRRVEGLTCDIFVSSDNFKGAYIGVSHLISQGYRRIAFFGGDKDLSNTKQRYEGYLTALSENDIKVDPDIVVYGRYTLHSGEALMEECLEKKTEFDAIFAACDLIAIGAIRVLKENAIKVPADIAVMGYDNIYISEFIEPPLTTVEQKIYEIASKVTQMLIAKIEGEKIEETEILIEPRLIIRETVRTVTQK